MARVIKKLFDFSRKTFNTYEKHMYENLFDALKSAEKEYSLRGKGDKQAFIAIFLMNHGIFAPPFAPGNSCYITSGNEPLRGIVDQVDTTVTKKGVGATIFYKTNDGDDRFFHGTEIGKRVFSTLSLANKKMTKENRNGKTRKHPL